MKDNLEQIQRFRDSIFTSDEKTLIALKRKIDIRKMKLVFYREAKIYYMNLRREFIVNDLNKSFYDALCLYFAQDILFESKYGGQLQKGLWIYSKVNGTGKTSTLKIIQNISRIYGIRNLWFPMISTTEVVSKYNNANNDKEYVIKNYSYGNYAFDDIGAEGQGNNFGREELFKRIIELRYNEYINKGIKTHFTSNFHVDELKDKLGVRCWDRLYEMTNFLHLKSSGNRW